MPGGRLCRRVAFEALTRLRGIIVVFQESQVGGWGLVGKTQDEAQ